MNVYAMIMASGTALLLLTNSVYANTESQRQGQGVKVEMEGMRSASNVAVRMTEIVKEGSNAVPAVIPFLDDDDVLMRENAAIILGRIRDPRAVTPLINTLHDKEPNVRRRAITSLYKIAEHAPTSIGDEQLASLTEYGMGTDENASLAILIIGKAIGKSGVPVIQQLREQAIEQIASGGGMAVIGRRKQEACLRVLANLGDKVARGQVCQMLSSLSPEDRAKGIEVVAYVGGDMAGELVPLLSDKRNAVDISPSHAGDYFLRVCDLAADVLRDTYHVELESQKRTRYSDRDLDVLKRKSKD